MTMTRTFLGELLKELILDSNTVQKNNFDLDRYSESGVRTLMKRRLFKLANGRRLICISERALNMSLVWARRIQERGTELEEIFTLLCDEHSQRIMVKCAAYEILGFQRVRMPVNDDNYWKSLDLIKRRMLVRRHTFQVPILRYIDLYNLNGAGYPIYIHDHPLAILYTFFLQQYNYDRGGHRVGVQEGDIVIDGGGCWGDSALYFLLKTGKGGRVFTFEFEPHNNIIMKKNLEINDGTERIKPICKALWERSNMEIGYTSQGLGASVNLEDKTGAKVRTVAIDDFVEENDLDRVDFIKLDIEGSELNAL